jgi:hypothetical protein
MPAWKTASPQAKVFMVTHVASMLAELVGEVSLYQLVPRESASVRTRFWAQYVIGAAFSIAMGSLGFLATDCLAKSGWNKAAWGTAVLPTVAAASGGFVLHGVDSILGSTSGTGSVALIRAAYASKKKKSAVL